MYEVFGVTVKLDDVWPMVPDEGPVKERVGMVQAMVWAEGVGDVDIEFKS